MRPVYFLLSAGVLLTNFLIAQTGITGRVTEQSTGEPLAFVNVVLFTTDSSLVKGVTTDTAGNFSIPPVARDSYYLQVSFIGFETFFTPRFFADSAGKHFGTIAIVASAQVLGGFE